MLGTMRTWRCRLVTFLPLHLSQHRALLRQHNAPPRGRRTASTLRLLQTQVLPGAPSPPHSVVTTVRFLVEPSWLRVDPQVALRALLLLLLRLSPTKLSWLLTLLVVAVRAARGLSTVS